MKNNRLEKVLLPIFVFIVAYAGWLSMVGGAEWYAAQALPIWAPSPNAAMLVWDLVFICLVLSLFDIAKLRKQPKALQLIRLVFFLTLAAYLLWSFLFFGTNDMFLATWAAAVSGMGAAALILLVKPHSHRAALLLFPYAVWATVAAFLSYVILLVN